MGRIQPESHFWGRVRGDLLFLGANNYRMTSSTDSLAHSGCSFKTPPVHLALPPSGREVGAVFLGGRPAMPNVAGCRGSFHAAAGRGTG